MADSLDIVVLGLTIMDRDLMLDSAWPKMADLKDVGRSTACLSVAPKSNILPR